MKIRKIYTEKSEYHFGNASTGFSDNEQKSPTPLAFHIPAGVLAKIVSYVSDGGPDALKNWILAGPEGKLAVFSKETLSRVSFERNPLFMLWSKPESSYYIFFSKCLEHKNQQAIYVQSIKLAFCDGDLYAAKKLTKTIQDAFPTASLLHIMLCSFSGVEDLKAYYKFKSKHQSLEEVEHIGDCLTFHVNLMEPRREDSYAATWRFQYIPECSLNHNFFGGKNGVRCLQCIYYYLSIQLCMLS